jgi:hypothetical protein
MLLMMMGLFELEPYKRAKYSKSLDPDEMEEVLVYKDSNEELEERGKVMEACVHSERGSGNEKVFFLPNRYGHSKHISYKQVMWWQNDA